MDDPLSLLPSCRCTKHAFMSCTQQGHQRLIFSLDLGYSSDQRTTDVLGSQEVYGQLYACCHAQDLCLPRNSSHGAFSINLAYTGISIILATSQAPGNKMLSRCLLLIPEMPNFADGYAENVPFCLSFTLRSFTAGTIRHETGSQASELANYRLYSRAVAVTIKHHFLRPKSAP